MRITKTAAVLGAFGMLLLSLSVSPHSVDAQEAEQPPRATGLVVLESTRSFEDTWFALIAALDANPAIRTIGQVDHAAAAASSGLSLQNNRVVFFGNPALGTPVMQASRTAGIDLPQKMHVFQDGRRVFVAYNTPTYLSSRHGTGGVASLATIEGALAGLARAATNTEVAIGQVSSPTSAPGAGLVTTPSANDFETTWTALLAAIEASPAAVAFTVDHGANSGGALPPTRLVVFGNPAIGTPIMASSATAGVDLPLKMLVYEDDAGTTQVVSTSPGYVQSRHGVGDVATIGGATNAIANFTAAATTTVEGADASAAGDGPEADAPSEDNAAPDETLSDDATGDDDTTNDDDAEAEDEVLGATELAFTGSDPAMALIAVGLIGCGSLFLIGGRRKTAKE